MAHKTGGNNTHLLLTFPHWVLDILFPKTDENPPIQNHLKTSRQNLVFDSKQAPPVCILIGPFLKTGRLSEDSFFDSSYFFYAQTESSIRHRLNGRFSSRASRSLVSCHIFFHTSGSCNSVSKFDGLSVTKPNTVIYITLSYDSIFI